MIENCGKQFIGERKDGRIFAGTIIDVWSWPSTNPEKGEMIVIKQQNQQIKSVYLNNLVSYSIE